MTEKVCPITTSGTGDSSFMDCQGEKCGLWNKNHAKCSVETIADAFGRIGDGLYSISNSLSSISSNIR